MGRETVEDAPLGDLLEHRQALLPVSAGKEHQRLEELDVAGQYVGGVFVGPDPEQGVEEGGVLLLEVEHDAPEALPVVGSAQVLAALHSVLGTQAVQRSLAVACARLVGVEFVGGLQSAVDQLLPGGLVFPIAEAELLVGHRQVVVAAGIVGVRALLRLEPVHRLACFGPVQQGDSLQPVGEGIRNPGLGLEHGGRHALGGEGRGEQEQRHGDEGGEQSGRDDSGWSVHRGESYTERAPAAGRTAPQIGVDPPPRLSQSGSRPEGLSAEPGGPRTRRGDVSRGPASRFASAQLQAPRPGDDRFLAANELGVGSRLHRGGLAQRDQVAVGAQTGPEDACDVVGADRPPLEMVVGLLAAAIPDAGAGAGVLEEGLPAGLG